MSSNSIRTSNSNYIVVVLVAVVVEVDSITVQY